jgi:hypothetical protein
LTGFKFVENEIRLSRNPTGAPSRTEFCQQPGKITARLYVISLRIMQRPTTPQTHSRLLLSDVDD